MEDLQHREFLDLYRPIHERFERFCKARVYGQFDFRDLMHETLLVAYQKRNELKSKEAFLAFLFGVATRILANQNRKIKETIFSASTLAYHQAQYSDNEVDIHFLYQALGQLNVEQKEAIILFEISGFSVKEVAEIQAVSESAVKQRLKRGRDRLIEIMNYESVIKTGNEL